MTDLQNAIIARRYRVRTLLGEGGFGEVWLADDLECSGTVAVKVLRATQAADALARRRLLREVRAAARLSHPAIIGVRGAGEDSQVGPYLALEYFEGQHLGTATTHSVTGEMLLHMLDQTLDALAYAHAHGVVHRDLKPENVLWRRDDTGRCALRVLDFGLARVEGDVDMQITAAHHSTLGTPAYMAPELATGLAAASPRSDLYSLGVLMWELSTGKPPYLADSAAALLLEHVRAPLPPFVPRPGLTLPTGWPDLLRHMLAKAPTDRPEDAAAVRATLTALRNEPPSDDTDSTHTLSGLGWSTEPTQGDHRLPSALSLLEGREAEQRQLWSHLTRLAEVGGVESWAVLGDVGSGRTSLCRWLVEACVRNGLATVLDLTAAGEGAPDALAFAAREALGWPHRRPQHADRSLPALWPTEDGRTEAERLEEWSIELTQAATRRPLLLWVGRWETLAPLERRRLLALRGRLATQRIHHATLVAATPETFARSLGAGLGVESTLTLQPLPAGVIAAVARARTPELDAAAVEILTRTAAGSAFSTEWLGRLAAYRVSDRPHAPLEVALAVLDTLVADSEGRGSKLLRATTALSTLGLSFSDDEAEALLRADGFSQRSAIAALEQLVELGVLTEPSTTLLQFSHPLVHTAAQVRLPSERARAHFDVVARRRAAQPGRDPRLVAHALAASGRLEDAVALLAEAARGALEAFDALRVEHLLDGCGHILDSVVGGPERERIPLGQRLEIDLLRARLCLEQGRARDALKHLDAVTPRLRAMPGEASRYNDALTLEAECLLRLGDAVDARTRTVKTLEAAQMAGDPRRQAVAGWLHGTVELMSGDLGAARSLLLAARAELSRSGQRIAEVRCRLDLSALAEAAGDSAAALRLARDAAAMQTQAAPHPAFGEAQVRVAELHRRAGQWSEARDAYAGALALYTRLGQQEASARCAKGLGHIERLLSRHAESRRAYLLALAGFTSSGDAHQAAQCQMHIGWLAAQAGEHRDAERWFLRALQALQQSEDTLRVGLVYAFLARVAQASGDRDLRQRRLGEALRLDAMRPLSVPEWPRTLEAIASAQVAEGDIEAARAGLRRALQVWQFLGSTQDEARVRGRLSALDAPRS